MQSEGQWHLHHGRTEEAVDAFERAMALIKKNVCFNWLTMATIPSLVTALRVHADSIERTEPSEADVLRKRAYRIIRRARPVFRFFPTDHSYVLREYALMLAQKGSKRKALRVIEKSCAGAEKRAEAYQLAESRLARAKLRYSMELDNAKAEMEAAEKELAEYHSLVDATEPERLMA